MLHPCVLSQVLDVYLCLHNHWVVAVYSFSAYLDCCFTLAQTSLYVFLIFLGLLNIICVCTCCNIILNISQFITPGARFRKEVK